MKRTALGGSTQSVDIYLVLSRASRVARSCDRKVAEVWTMVVRASATFRSQLRCIGAAPEGARQI
jgi:hypothetical protein